MSWALSDFYPLLLHYASHLYKRQMVSHGNEPVIVPSDMNVIENVKRRVYFSCDALHHRKLRGFTGENGCVRQADISGTNDNFIVKGLSKTWLCACCTRTGFWERLVNSEN